MKAFIAVVALLSTSAWAESPWLSARGRVADGLRLEGWGGPRTLGVGMTAVPEAGRGALTAEASVSLVDRMLEVRGARVWQVTKPRFATVSAAVAVTTFFIPGPAFDIGAGPHGQLTLGLGGERVAVDVGLHSGIELFVRGGGPRFPQRLSLGLTVRVGPVAVLLAGRTGIDVTPGYFFVFRGEAVLGLGWWRPSKPPDAGST